jgi:serine/threonine protein kinase
MTFDLQAPPLGFGGMGSVHFGTWHGSPVAIKVLLQHRKRSEAITRKALLTEAEVLSNLRHPCICSFFGVLDLDDGRNALVLEFMGGGSLSDYLQLGTPYGRPIDLSLLPRISREVASGLLYLHRAAFLHRDVKATNILLTAHHGDRTELHAKVADFGLTKQHELRSTESISPDDGPPASGTPRESASTSPANVHTRAVGTLHYMAPEVSRMFSQGGKGEVHAKYDQSCDVYSYGLLLWEITHGERAFSAIKSSHVTDYVSRGGRPPIKLGMGREPFGSLIEVCWSQTPDDRPTMAEVFTWLSQVEAAYRGGTGALGFKPWGSSESPLPPLNTPASLRLPTIDPEPRHIVRGFLSDAGTRSRGSRSRGSNVKSEEHGWSWNSFGKDWEDDWQMRREREIELEQRQRLQAELEASMPPL